MIESLLDLFISTANAAGETAAQAQPKGLFDGPMGLILMVGFVVVFFFITIRPQQKKAKETKSMLESLGKGDEISTVGGIIGKITAIDENYVTVEIAQDIKVKFQKQAIGGVLPKGTIKSIQE
ncbi:MAG: preprotein translocase subunit YajC [Gammaproteobacteria bacterium]|nr:MAG: preprotein translocase subunit YajC [Gammaproteobacteria bacterium]